MDSLNDILSHLDFDEPAEIKLIKSYVQNNFKIAVEVIVREHAIIINTPNAALANTLRLRSPQLKKLCQTDKRLIFHIG